MMFVVLFPKRHVRWHSDFHVELFEIGSRLLRELNRDSPRHQREIPRYQADSVGGARREAIASSVYLRLDKGSREGFRSTVDQPRRTARTSDREGGSTFRQPQVNPLKRSRSAVDRLYEPSCGWRRDSG